MLEVNIFLSFSMVEEKKEYLKKKKKNSSRTSAPCLTSFSILCIARNEPCLQVDISIGSLPSSFVFPSVVGKVIEGTECSCLVSAEHFQGTRNMPNHRPLKDQRQREKLATKPGHLLEWLTAKQKQTRLLHMRVLGKVLDLFTRQNIQVSKYSSGLLTLNLLLLLSTHKDAPTRWEDGCAGDQPAPLDLFTPSVNVVRRL